jgi:hypothetical protein
VLTLSGDVARGFENLAWILKVTPVRAAERFLVRSFK